VALVSARAAFLEDCARAAIVVTPLRAPEGCAAPLIIDRIRLADTGAVSLRFPKEGGALWTTARGVDEDRPWSPRPQQTVKLAAAPEDEESDEAELAESME
jgi:competence protein ComEC